MSEPFEQLAHKIDPHSRLLHTWELKGGVSAQVTALEIERPDGQTKKLVVRRHGPGDLKQNPNIAADEFKLLQIVQSAGLAAPAPYYVDQSGDIFATPYIVVDYIDGATEFAPADLNDLLLQMATYLSRVHTIDTATVDVSFLPGHENIYTEKLSKRPAHIDESIDEGRIRDVLESAWPLPRRNRSILLHGDFWPGNILWKDGQLAAVIDWEDAKVGDPLADVANTRLEVLWAFGIDAMEQFTDYYRSMTAFDFTDLPYWDLCAALRPAFKLAEWAADDAAEQTMRAGHRIFITQAFERVCV